MARVFGLIVFALSLVFFSQPSSASSNASYDSALATCSAYSLASAYPHVLISGETCSPDIWRGTHQVLKLGTVNGTPCNGPQACNWGAWPFTGVVPSNCEQRPELHKGFDGANTEISWGGCKYRLKEDEDGTVKVCLPTAQGVVCTGSATWEPTGEPAQEGETPPVEAPPVPPAPKLCGGGSCYDPATDQDCAVSSSGQVCLPRSGTPGHGSGCISSGDTTLCSGSPPPSPPNPPIADPASQIAASDTYTDQRGAPESSSISNVTVNNYNTTGSGANNGAQPGDTGNPASSSTAPAPPGDGTRASGGRDCNSPPICEGSQATCMVVTQTYLLRCPPGGQTVGPGEGDGDTTVPGLDGISEGPGDGFIRTETVLDKLDTGGLGGGGQCPTLLTLDLDQFGVHYDGNSPEWCDILDKAGYMLMFIAAFISLRILSEK